MEKAHLVREKIPLGYGRGKIWGADVDTKKKSCTFLLKRDKDKNSHSGHV